jgi:hypothetical protein
LLIIVKVKHGKKVEWINDSFSMDRKNIKRQLRYGGSKEKLFFRPNLKHVARNKNARVLSSVADPGSGVGFFRIPDP